MPFASARASRADLADAASWTVLLCRQQWEKTMEGDSVPVGLAHVQLAHFRSERAANACAAALKDKALGGFDDPLEPAGGYVSGARVAVPLSKRCDLRQGGWSFRMGVCPQSFEPCPRAPTARTG